jgi:ABC-type Na+ efflux pump permease subunit
MLDNFNRLISTIKPITVIVALYGIVMLIAAMSKNGRAALYFNGALALLSAIAIHALDGGSIGEIFFMVLFILIIITAAFILYIRLFRYGWILRKPDIPPSKDGKE